MNNFIRGALAAALALPVVSAAAPATAEPAPKAVKAVPMQVAIAALPSAEEFRIGYTRSSFRHWVDADRDGCSTRGEILIEEAVVKPEVGPGCKLTGGGWFSYYDGKFTENPRSLEIDHVVPLAEAWDSGAARWSAEKRQRYANDLDAPRSLVAVTAKHLRAKADKDPSQWWVPNKAASCRYLQDWVSTKTRWKLAVDDQERTALREHAAECAARTISTKIAD